MAYPNNTFFGNDNFPPPLRQNTPPVAQSTYAYAYAPPMPNMNPYHQMPPIQNQTYTQQLPPLVDDNIISYSTLLNEFVTGGAYRRIHVCNIFESLAKLGILNNRSLLENIRHLGRIAQIELDNTVKSGIFFCYLPEETQDNQVYINWTQNWADDIQAIETAPSQVCPILFIDVKTEHLENIEAQEVLVEWFNWTQNALTSYVNSRIINDDDGITATLTQDRLADFAIQLKRMFETSSYAAAQIFYSAFLFQTDPNITRAVDLLQQSLQTIGKPPPPISSYSATHNNMPPPPATLPEYPERNNQYSQASKPTSSNNLFGHFASRNDDIQPPSNNRPRQTRSNRHSDNKPDTDKTQKPDNNRKKGISSFFTAD